MTPVIVAQDLSFEYDARPILRSVSFSVTAGEFFIVIGPNGSGKSTLMKILAGLLRPRGRLEVDGGAIGNYSGRELARRVAFVPQQLPAEFPFSVAEVVAMGRAPHQGILGLGGAADHAAVRRAMRFTDIGDLAGRRVSRLSGGELQRVFIAQAICQEPRIILLDEPTAFLDMAHQVQVMDLLLRLKAERNTTVVMISHDINLAALYGERLLLMQRGRVVRIGPPEEVLLYNTLEAVYGCRVLVDRSPLGAYPRVTPVPGRTWTGSKESDR